MITATFAIPGDLDTPTGGYRYDRAVIENADPSEMTIRHLRLPGGFPAPSDTELAQTRALLVGIETPLLIDGLALGTFPDDLLSVLPPYIGLCHHPLGLETGLTEAGAHTLLTCEAKALAKARHVITTSHSTADALTGTLGLSDSAITVAEPGLARAEPAPRRGDPPVILSIGSLTPRKGHDILVRALSTLVDLPWICKIAGPVDRDTAWTDQIRQLITRAGLQDRIMLTGALEQAALDTAYAGADLFCLPSHYEGYGMVFAEAMMRALPVVACRAGAVPEVVPNTAGLLAPPGNPAVLADFLGLLLTNPNSAQQLSRGARTHALTRPGWADTARIISNVIKEYGL